MKKLNFEIIKKVDYLLVFLVAVFGLIALLVNIISDIFPIHHKQRQPAHIEIIDSETEEDSAKLTENINFMKKLKDVYVFSVSTSAIKSNELSKSNIESKQLENVMQKHSTASEIINFIFVKDEQELKLFSTKAFIYKYELADDDNSSSYIVHKHNFNIYAVIKEDSNNDKQLDSKDKISLYVSDYNGNNLKEISSSIYYVDCIDENTILFTEYSNGKVSYYEYNGNLKTTKLIKSIEKEVTEKSIDLY